MLLLLLGLVMELLLLLLMEVMMVHLFLLLPAHFHVHILPPPASPSASATPSSASPLNIEPASCSDCSTHVSHHPSWCVGFRHRADTGPASGPWGTLSLGSSWLSTPLLGGILRHERVRTHR